MRKIILGAVLALVALLATPASAPAIVNGTDATINPGAVSLWTDNPNRNRCTGALIDDEQGAPDTTRWVLTAAHCIYSFTAEGAGNTTARIGSTDNTTGYTAIQVVPGQFWWNPAFDPNTLGYDVMLLKLAQETPPGATIMKWRKPSLPIGAVTTAYGWGWICDGPAGLPCSSWYSGPLQKMHAASLPLTNCYLAVPSQVCFRSSPDGPTMACPGDSGGPMEFIDPGNRNHVLRWAIAGDGDPNWDSCTQGVNGAPGRGLAIDIGRPDIQTWITSVMGGTARQARTAPPAPTPRILHMIN